MNRFSPRLNTEGGIFLELDSQGPVVLAEAAQHEIRLAYAQGIFAVLTDLARRGDALAKHFLAEAIQ